MYEDEGGYACVSDLRGEYPQGIRAYVLLPAEGKNRKYNIALSEVTG